MADVVKLQSQSCISFTKSIKKARAMSKQMYIKNINFDIAL